MKKSTYLIKAAGGNVTAVRILKNPKSRVDYESAGRDLIFTNRDQAVEQAGFLILSVNHFEMSGGEFCGNAARAALLLLSHLKKTSNPRFTMSGFSGQVTGSVEKEADGQYLVSCFFPGMIASTTDVNLGQPAQLVDLGGIVHVVIEGDFPAADFARQHLRIRQKLKLDNREAVGVVWARKKGLEARIDPVVWVKGIDSFFYESSCGSGSIAAAQVFTINRIIQPTGGVIEVEIKPQGITLKSLMEVINEKGN